MCCVLSRLTFKRGEASVEDQLEIAELSLREDNCRERFGFGLELLPARRVAGDEVLEDAACVSLLDLALGFGVVDGSGIP